MTREELLDLIPAYALDALDADEKAEVETLLKHDSDAQALLADYEAVASMLVFAVPERPAPSHLRADLKAQLAQRTANLETSHMPAPALSPVTKGMPAPKTIPFPTRLLSVAAAVVVVAIGLVVFVMNNNSTLSPNEVLYNQLIEQDNVNRFTLTAEAADDATGDLLISADNSEAVLRVTSLPDTTSDENYQLWLITDDNTVQSGGVFDWATGHGPYYISIPPDAISNLAAVGMTIEPFDGSDAPTGERLFAVSVASAN